MTTAQSSTEPAQVESSQFHELGLLSRKQNPRWKQRRFKDYIPEPISGPEQLYFTFSRFLLDAIIFVDLIFIMNYHFEREENGLLLLFMIPVGARLGLEGAATRRKGKFNNTR
jgi:hypothetical protein